MIALPNGLGAILVVQLGLGLEGLVYNVDVSRGRSVLQILASGCPRGERCPLWITYNGATEAEMTAEGMLIRIRMAHARELLTATDFTMAVIAERVGYQSVYAFSKAFKRTLGVTPSSFRASAPKTSPSLSTTLFSSTTSG